jgi:AraC family transcriptional regulator of adaptative response/methylated-DNA-[protein]-cysteine methyltransferase
MPYFRSRHVLRWRHDPRMMLETPMPPAAHATLPLWPMPERLEMERAYLRSDASYDGVFYLGVRTTGIFCRPSCTARKPKPENVDFFALPKDAIEAGYRACLRCRPLEDDQTPSWVRTLIERIDQRPDEPVRERELQSLGIDPGRARRYFETRYGLTFQAYCRARRLSRAFERIRDGEPIDDTVFEAGFESHSGFREAFQKAFGTTPGQAASARRVCLTWVDTPIGPMVAGATDAGICLLEFTDRRSIEHQLATLRTRLDAALVPLDHPHLTALRTQLAEYFRGTRRDFDLPLEAPGTPFEMRVWKALCGIPYGETRSYADIAQAVDSPAAVRAVGRANGLNRIAIVIPCHRVVNKSGELGGYGGGLWRKRRLLHLERGVVGGW